MVATSANSRRSAAAGSSKSVADRRSKALAEGLVRQFSVLGPSAHRFRSTNATDAGMNKAAAKAPRVHHVAAGISSRSAQGGPQNSSSAPSLPESRSDSPLIRYI